MNLYPLFVPQTSQMLQNLADWLSAGVKHAAAVGFEPTCLLSARLFPDQYALLKQVQICCDTSKLTASRLAGREAPTHNDTEQTFEELHSRIAAVREYLASFAEADFAEAAQRRIPLPFMPERVMRGQDYLVEFALPNLYFHVGTAYNILRHTGVPLGKQAYIGRLTTESA